MHEGHRQRLRSRFLKTGTAGMAEHEVLELLLTYAIPRADVNPLAHTLIAEFGSLRGVLNAPPGAVAKVKGCGENTAALLSLVREIARLLEAADLAQADLSTPTATALHLRALLRGVRHECVYALYLSTNYKLLDERVVTEGTVDQSVVFPRHVVEQALAAGAAHVILAHNHPGGSLKASRADADATGRIQSALATVGIRLAEHFIVSEAGAYGILSGERIDVPQAAQVNPLPLVAENPANNET